MNEREAAESMREAAAKKAERLFNCISLGPGREEDIVARDTGKQIAAAIRALPLPEPPHDPRDAIARAEKVETERDRLRTFVRSARGIVQHYASANPKQVWSGYEIDPLGAHAWLVAETTEIGTMRDGGDPKVEART